MTIYVAVHVPNVTAFNRQLSGFLAESTEFESEFFVDVHLSEQERIARTFSAGEKSLDYGPVTPDVLATFIRLAGDGASQAQTLDELDRSMEQDYQPIDADKAEQIGLHPIVVQAIEEEVVDRAYASRSDEGRDVYLTYQTSWE